MDRMLEVQEVDKNFGGLYALNKVELYVTEGEIAGLIGPNGSGKTTLFNVISGVYKPTNGKVTFDGVDISSKAPEEISKLGIARTYQLVRPFLNMAAADNVMVGALFGSKFRARKSLKEARKLAEKSLEMVGIPRTDWDKPISYINLVNRKRIDLAKALAQEPRIILIDEVAAGLNPSEKEYMIDLLRHIRENNITLLIVEHDMRTIMTVCDRITVLNFGHKIAEGTPAEVEGNTEVIRAYLGEKYAESKQH